MTADSEDTAGVASAPPESGTLLELSADAPGTVDESLEPEPGAVTLQVSSEAVAVREDAVDPPELALPPCLASWRLLLLASPRDRHDRFRRPLSRWFLREMFWPPLRADRHMKVAQYVDAGPWEVWNAAEEVLVRTVWKWGREDGRAEYSDLVRYLRNKLNDDVAREFLGPDARKLWRSDEGDPPGRLDEILDARDDEEDGAALPEKFEKPPVGSDALVARQNLKRLLDRAEFGRGERECWTRVEVDGLSYEETAEVTPYTAGTVKVKVSRARGALRDAAQELAG